MILTSFGGIIPRLAPHKLALNQATIAHDAKLCDGVLEAWCEPRRFASAMPRAKTIHMHGCCPVSWADIVDVAELTPDWERFYITRGNGLEQILLDGNCNQRVLSVGVPAPLSAPVAQATEQCSREADARAYVYTYVNEWGEESAPSLPSNIVRVDDGSTVTVSGFASPPAGKGIVLIHLYRASTGFRVADGKVQKPLTDYLFVTQLSTSATTFTDRIMGTGLGPALETQYDREPPAGLSGITSIGDQVRLAGFTNNIVHFSEQFQPHNWPAKYDLTLDYYIVHMKALDQRLFVTTNSIPYIIDVSSCDDTKCTPVTSLETPLPDIGCQYAHGAIMTPHGMMYASPLGLILLQPNATWNLITAKWFGEKEWRKLRPDTIRMAYWKGYLFFATDMATFLLNINSQPYGDMDGAELCTLSDRPMDMIITDTGELLFLQDGAIWVWDGGTKLRPYIWESREITATSLAGQNALASQGAVRDYNWWPTSIKLGGAAHATITDSHGHSVFDRLIITERPHRVARRGRHLWYKLRLNGVEAVEHVAIGTAMSTVNGGK